MIGKMTTAFAAAGLLLVAGTPGSAQLAVKNGATQSATGVMITLVTMGYIDPHNVVPAVNKVPGATVSNLDLSFPVSVLKHGYNYVYQIASQNTTYTGTCKATYTLSQVQGGKTVTLASGIIKKSWSCAAGGAWAWDISGKASIPDSPGVAKLTGTITYGANHVSMSVPVLIQ